MQKPTETVTAAPTSNAGFWYMFGELPNGIKTLIATCFCLIAMSIALALSPLGDIAERTAQILVDSLAESYRIDAEIRRMQLEAQLDGNAILEDVVVRLEEQARVTNQLKATQQAMLEWICSHDKDGPPDWCLALTKEGYDHGQ